MPPSPSSPLPLTATVLGYSVYVATMPEVLAAVTARLDAGNNCHVVTANPEMLMQAEADPSLATVLKRADLVIPDGAGVVWAIKRQGVQAAERLPGIEFAELLLAKAAMQRWPVAMIGTRPEVLDAAVARLTQKYPGLTVVFAHHGFFENSVHMADIAAQCAAQQPKVVLLALGVPRQEFWIRDYGPLFCGAALVGVGGSFDVWSGLKKRAPALFRSLNLEWLYRLASEPQRISRLTKTIPAFVWRVMTAKPAKR